MKNIPTIDLQAESLLAVQAASSSIRIQPLFEDSGLPLSVECTGTPPDLGKFIETHRPAIEADLHRFGGILFRGFQIDKVPKFDALMSQFNDETIPYMFRSSPRYALSNRVYVSTTYPNQRKINMHSESSYSYAWGKKILFCCIQPAEKQGETPIADNRKVLANLSPELIAKFEQFGVLYQRNLSEHVGLPWQEVFQTEDPAEVERVCKANKIGFKFKNPKHLTIAWKKPALYQHPATEERIWFNHAFFFNKYSLYEEMGLNSTDNFPKDMLSSNTYFGNGKAISFAEYSEMKTAYEAAKVVFPWQQGDLLLLDNMLSAHGRNPYEGARKIVVSIVEPYHEHRTV